MSETTESGAVSRKLDVAGIRAALAKATPGPWEQGWRYGVAAVLPRKFGEGKCHYCSFDDPVWVGEAQINGQYVEAHKHREVDGFGRELRINSLAGEVVRGEIDSQDEGNSSGVLSTADAELIVLLRNNAEALLEALEALEAS